MMKVGAGDRLRDILRERVDERMAEFDRVFQTAWRDRSDGKMPGEVFIIFIDARNAERDRLVKEMGLEE